MFNEGQVDHFDNIYNFTTLIEDYINPNADGNLRWKCMSSCTSNSGEALENWKNLLHEVSMRRCARITKFIRQVGTQSRPLPTYERLTKLATFLTEFEELIIES